MKNSKNPIHSLIETHLENMNKEDSKILRKILQKKQLLRYEMQVTYDFFGSSPVHRALKDVYKLDNETEEDLEHIRTEQKFAAKFIIDKMFQNEMFENE